MDFTDVPVGFSMALAKNEAAMLHYASLSKKEKQNILDKAHNVHSKNEMDSLVASLAVNAIQ